MGVSSTVLASVVALLLLVQPSFAMFEDQAGAFDWYKPFVGPVTTAALQKKRLYVGSDRNVVGCLNLRDGSIAWRRLLDADDTIDAIELLDTPALLLSLSGNGTYLRAWDQIDGSLKWQLLLTSSQSASAALEGKTQDGPAPNDAPGGMMAERVARPSMVVKYGDDGVASEVVTVSNGEIRVIDPFEGSVLVSKTLTGFASMDVLYADLQSDGNYMAFGYSSGFSTIRVASLGSSLSESAFEVDASLSRISAVGPVGIAALSSDFASLCLAGPSGASCSPLSVLAPDLPVSEQSLKLYATSTGFLLVSNDQERPGAALIKVASAGETAAELVAYYPSASVATAAMTTPKGQVIGLLQIDASVVTLKVVLTTSGKEVSSETMPLAKQTISALVDVEQNNSAAVAVSAAYLGSFKRKDKPDGFRLLMVSKDHYVSLHQQGVTVWGREEALGTVTSTLFLDLPGPAASSAQGAEEGAADASAAANVKKTSQSNFEKFLYMQFLGVKHQLKIHTAEESTILANLREQTSDKNQPIRDNNGYRKLILALTSCGKLLALHNGDGRVVWSCSYDADVDGGVPQFLLNWKTFHDLTHAPQVALLYAGPGGRGSYVSIVNAHTGAEVERVLLGYSADKIIATHIQLAADGHSEQNIYMVASVGGIAGGAPTVHLLPDNEASRDWFITNYRQLYFWAIDDNIVTGYGFDGTAVVAALEESVENPIASLPAVQTWQAVLPDAVLAMATRDPSEPIASSVKVLGDRSIKYKYLNPNTLFLVVGKAAGTPQSERDPARLTALILDTVTGRVLHSQTHNLARGPVRAVFHEHQIVYDFWDCPASRRSTVSIELYDATDREFSVLDYLFNPNSTRPVSSFVQAPVEALSQAFYPRVPIVGLAATRTGQGITSKWLLLLTSSGQVYAMDSRLVDPRRPKSAKLSKNDMEERLLPYQEILPMAPNMFLTTNKQVLGLRAVDVSPSRLESTSLLLARGLDLYYTRISPAKAYDSLEDDFSYGLLLMALTGLAAASAGMSWWTKKSILAQKWK